MNDENEELITVQEMADFLKISRSKAYQLVKSDDFPITKIGKCIRISKKALKVWLHNAKNMI